MYFALPTHCYSIIITCAQDEISFRYDVPIDGDSVDAVDVKHAVVMTVPPNKVKCVTIHLYIMASVHP